MTSLSKYNNQFLVPISTVTINQAFGANVDGQCVRPTYTIDLNGYLIYNAGSPTSSGTFGNYRAEDCEIIDNDERLNSLLAKHQALSVLFSQNYKELELGTTTGSPNLKAYPRVVSISLSDTSNPSYWLYTVSLEADNLYTSGVPIYPTGCDNCVKSFEESWSISYDESEILSESGNNRLFKIEHQLSAVGVGIAGTGGLITSPYLCAKNFVCSKKGANAIVPTTCIDNFNCTGTQYNYYESHNIDTAGGSYSLTESWICHTGNYIESYSVETQESADVACPTVSIQGSVRGFETRVSGIVPSGGSKYYNAKARWDAMVAASGPLLTAENISGYDLNPYPTNGSVGYNKLLGEINYNYSYKNQQFRYLPSAKMESIQYGGNWGEDVLAELQPIGRGGVLHGINYDVSGIARGHKLLKKTLAISAVYPCGTGISRRGPRFSSPHSGELQAVVNYYNPTGDADSFFVGVDSQNENWNPADGSYTYSIGWTIQQTGTCTL